MNVVNALSYEMAFAFTTFFFTYFHQIIQMDKINKIKVNNVTYEIGSNVDMSQYQLKSDAVKLVRLTQAEYDQLTPKDNNTLYIITDAQ